MTALQPRGLTAKAVVLASILLTPFVAATPSVHGFQDAGQFASVVIGQPNFVSSTGTATQNHLFRPQRVAFDQLGNLWVTDENNFRILEFKHPFSNGESASLVIGQASFTSHLSGTAQNKFFRPVGATFDSSNNLWVADNGNNRVLEFKPPFADGMNASLELGQRAGSQRFTANISSSEPNGLNAPVDLRFDVIGNLWVSDRGNNRVLEFKPPFTDGMNAWVVIGQTNMTSGATSFSPSQNNFYGPGGIAFDFRGDLWIADYGFNRVLEFAASSLMSNGPPAILELGQPAGADEFSSSLVETSRSGLANPNDLAFDASGDLWVSDRANNRILAFKQPFTDGMNASSVIGHLKGPEEFTDNSTGLTQAALRNPLGIAFDSYGNLWLADQLNNRVLEFSGAADTTAGTNVDIPTTTAQTVMNVSSSGNTCYRTGMQTICHLAANQVSTTGVQMDMVGVASASTVNVYSSHEFQEPSYGRTPMSQDARAVAASPTTFYGIAISGIVNGTATVCLSRQTVGESAVDAEMIYFSDGSWRTPTSVSRSASTICGTIPLSALQPSGETSLIAIGNVNGTRTPGPGAGPALFAFALLAIVVIGATLVTRRRARNIHSHDEAENEEDEEGTW